MAASEMGGVGAFSGMSGGSVASGIGQGASGIMNYYAVKGAERAQQRAIRDIQARIEAEMTPEVVNDIVRKYDELSAKNRLALQAQIDPELAKQRGGAEKMISKFLEDLSSGKTPTDTISSEAVKQAMAKIPGMAEGIAGLTSAANKQLALGASLPADLQAELMQAGLEQSGAVTGTAGMRGVGGVILPQILGSAGIALQQQRQTQAASLFNAASNLDAQRQQILQSLFPKLQAQQMANLSAASGILQQSNSMMPNAGMTGQEAGNLWLARMGALNNLRGQSGSAEVGKILGAAAAMGQVASSFGTAMGGSGGGSGGSARTPDYASFFNSGGGGGDYAGEQMRI